MALSSALCTVIASEFALLRASYFIALQLDCRATCHQQLWACIRSIWLFWTPREKKKSVISSQIVSKRDLWTRAKRDSSNEWEEMGSHAGTSRSVHWRSLAFPKTSLHFKCPVLPSCRRLSTSRVDALSVPGSQAFLHATVVRSGYLSAPLTDKGAQWMFFVFSHHKWTGMHVPTWDLVSEGEKTKLEILLQSGNPD